MKYVLICLVVLSVLTLLIAACRTGSPSSASGIPQAQPSPSAQLNHISMDASQFLPNTITIQKGNPITLTDEATSLHVLANGTWQSNGIPKYAREAGAPKVEMQFQQHESRSIGPFPTAGTFHLYCTVHPGMNLTIIVV